MSQLGLLKSLRLAGIGFLGHSGGMSTVRAQVARLRKVALAALARYPLPEGRLTFVAR
jgi:hypothetical protein